MAISVSGFFLGVLVLARGISQGYFRLFPLFYSYMIYVLLGTGVMYGFLEFKKTLYPAAFWYYYLITILVEFSVLVEISDHIFKSFPVIRRLGRTLTIAVSAVFAILYVLPSIIHAHDPRSALLSFTMRASATKLAVILVLLFVSRHLKINLGKNVGGLMLGFSLFHGVNIANYAAAGAFGPRIYSGMLWLMGPLSYALCVIVWAVALWNYAPEPIPAAANPAGAGNLPLELARYNQELSRYLER